MAKNLDDIDNFVPDHVVRAELSISGMTLWRWDRSPELAAVGWPPPMRIARKKFRSRRLLELFKKNMLQRAFTARGKITS